MLASVYLNRFSLVDTINVFRDSSINYYMKYDFLRSIIDTDELILSDSNTNWFIPSFNGKVISSVHPLYWVKDLDERRDAVHSFFAKESSDSLRQVIIQKYNPNYILINYSEVDFNDTSLKWLDNIGKSIYMNDQLELIELK